MPNAINPNDYNIDYFSSGFLGITTASDFREYILNNNLQDLPLELVEGAAGNFTSQYEEKGLEKEINYTPITNPGSIDEWTQGANFGVSLFDIAYQNPSQNVGTNQYGPSTLQAFNYNNPELIVEDTGYIQYPTSTGGDDFAQTLKDTLLNDQFNLGPGSTINFPSDLNSIAKERRKEEAINRVKENVKDNVLGKLNLDPIGLLSGQDLILKDYKITTRGGVVGKIFDTIAGTAGFSIPTSPIKPGAFGKYGDLDNAETYKELLKTTGSGTKSLIFNSVSKNKYGPQLKEPTGLLTNMFGAGQAPQLKTYLSDPTEEQLTEKQAEKKIPLIDKINRTVGKVIDGIAGSKGIGKGEDLPPSEFENPTPTLDNLVKNSEYGFDSLDSENSSLLGGPLNQKNLEFLGAIFNFEVLPEGKFGLDTWGTPSALISPSDSTIGTKIPNPSESDHLINPQPLISEGSGGQKPYNDTKPFENGMYWAGDQEGRNPFNRGILKYTQGLVNASRGNSGSKARYIGVVNSSENFDKNTGRHSKYSMGNTVFKGTFDEDGKPQTSYCRSWSVRNPYTKVKDLIRHGATNEDGSEFSSLTTPDKDLSVLGNNGFVKITPYISDGWKGSDGKLVKPSLKLGNPSVQKYMLSIENLAWQETDHILKVPPCEVGPNGGRIMWFPPYDISFTDNSSVNWDSTQIIGRGEPMYTYNSTERTGTLGFKIVVDHSTAMSEIKKEGTAELLRYFAGCKDPIESAIPILPVTEIEEIKIAEQTETKIIPKKEVSNPGDYPAPLEFYFRNAYRFDKDTIGTNLETELTPPSPEKSPNYPSDWYRANPNGYLRGTIPTNSSDTGFTQQLNLTKNEQSLVKLEEMVKFLLTPDGKRFKIKIIGQTSDAGVNPNNLKLGQKRADTTKDYMFKLLKELEVSVGRIQALELGSQRDFPTETTWKNDSLRWSVSTTGEENQNLSQSINPDTGEVTIFQDEGQTDFDEDGNVITSQNGLTPNVTIPSAVDDRVTWISLEYNPEIDDLFTIDNKEQTETNVTQEASSSFNEKEREATENEALVQILAARASRYMAWECSYFERMKQNDEFVYKNLKEKLKYFHPAFHSMTPEGFNSRLTFLKQCTRQGPNIASNEPSNLAFGKPPICVLRVGDFYHTKIVIDSVNLTFDPLVWDLNPEGIGVQPMICTVDLNFKFIGGSSLGGPISQLQNAVGFNFFANTGLYNPRTIYTSTQDYNKTKPDSSTGLESEIPSGSVNNTEKTKLFGYGAYIRPGEVISEGTTGSENDIMTPPKSEIEENIKKKQIEDEGIVSEKTDELSQEELDTINQQFDKKVEDRSGAFKLKAQKTTQDLKSYDIIKEVDLCKTNIYTDSNIFILSSQETIDRLKVTYPSGFIKIFERSELGSVYSTGSDPKRYWGTIFDSDNKSTYALGQAYNSEGTLANGIASGPYTFVGYTNVVGTIAQDGIAKETEIESPPLTINVICCASDFDTNQVVYFTDIPFSGAC